VSRTDQHRADLRKDPTDVAAMFDEVAVGYDRTNTVLSVGNANLWRVATTRAVDPRPGQLILDVAAGTGTSSAALAAGGARVVALDFSAGMIAVGRRRQAGNPNVEFVQGDALKLPFEDDSFDAVTISFGLRNIVDPSAALAEFFRVTKPGGRIVVCEFSRPPARVIRAGYYAYLRYGMPLLTKLVSTNPDAYGYLMESIRDWPDQQAVAGMIREAGFERVAHRNLTEGIAALHRGFVPGTAAPVGAPTAEASVGAPRSESPDGVLAPASPDGAAPQASDDEKTES
jgi:demethylmenaquinone methyltransferase/2-methoxy-6-polyprenyl-1,4-benzoquinol methylase